MKPAKNYRDWTKVKIVINDRLSRPKGFKKKDIWVCALGENIGHENDGKGKWFTRPVLILRTYSNLTCHIVPLSTTSKRGYFYCEFDGHTGQTSVALLSQTRTIDSARLVRKIGRVGEADFNKIKERLKGILGL
jgi:mRNA-degrading endonuclease toxin of MazEF toxin-antitoxin module